MTWEPTDEEVREFRDSDTVDSGLSARWCRETLRAAWAVSPGPGLAEENERLRGLTSLFDNARLVAAWKAGCQRGHESTVEGCYSSALTEDDEAALEYLAEEEPATDPRDEVVEAAEALLAGYTTPNGEVAFEGIFGALRDAIAKVREVRGE